jgi:hypothetical protein
MYVGRTNIPISEQAAANFLSNIEAVLGSIDSQDIDKLRLYIPNRDAIAVSYDSSLQPFLGQTFGLNPHERRTRGLDEDLFVLKLIQVALKNKREGGGRVFLTSAGAYYVEGEEETSVVNWEWPGRDLVGEVVALLGEAKNTSH